MIVDAFGVIDGCCNDSGCFEVKERADEANFTHMIIACIEISVAGCQIPSLRDDSVVLSGVCILVSLP